MGIRIFEETATPMRIICLRIHNVKNNCIQVNNFFFFFPPLPCFNSYPKEDECVSEKRHRMNLLMVKKKRKKDFMARKFQTTKMSLEVKIKVEIKTRK